MASAATGRAHIRNEVIGSGVSNCIFNGLIAWFLLRSSAALHWGGQHSFAVDVIATGLLLPLIVALIVIPLQRSKLSKGTLAPIHLGAGSTVQSLADRFPASTFKSAVLFGLIGMLLIAPLTLAGFYLLGINEISPAHYAIFKGIWAGIIAAVLVVPMVLIALRAPA
jgi:hypothetical protein